MKCLPIYSYNVSFISWWFTYTGLYYDMIGIEIINVIEAAEQYPEFWLSTMLHVFQIFPIFGLFT